MRRAMEAALPGRIIQHVDTSNKRLREKVDRRRLQALRGAALFGIARDCHSARGTVLSRDV